MEYRAEDALLVPLRPSPSMIYNNLCAVGSSGLVYAHTRMGVFACGIPPQDDTASLQTKKVDMQHSSMVHSVLACAVEGCTLLVLANGAGLQVWDEAACALLYVWQLPSALAPPPERRCAAFVRGLAFTISEGGGLQLAAGCSSGTIQVFSITQGQSFRPLLLLKGHEHPITSIGSAYQSRRGIWAEDLGCQLVSCDDSGVLYVWQAQHDSAYMLVHRISLGIACASLAVRRDCIVVARTDGRIALYGLRDGTLRSEIVGHSRWLSAMDIHPARDIVATVSEDCTLGVWTLPLSGQQATCLLSQCRNGELLTGVAFAGDGANTVAACAYDMDSLVLYRPVP